MGLKGKSKGNYIKTKFPGVRMREHPEKRHQGKADRYYLIRYGRDGRIVSEGVGFASEGNTPQLAATIRTEIINNIRHGEGYQSLKEKRAIKRELDERKEAEKIAEAKENVPFSVLGDKYIEWAKHEKESSWKADDSRYRQHLKPLLGSVPVKDMSTITLERFKKDLSKKKGRGGKPLTPKTIQHCLTLVRQMYNKAAGWEIYYGPNPVTETAKTHKKFLSIPDNRRLRFLSREEADKLLTYLLEGSEDKKGKVKGKNEQLHDICVLGIYAGLRADEIFSLLWRDVDLVHDVINIKDPKGVIGRAAYITAPLKKMLVRRKGEESNKNALVFKSTKGCKIKEVSNAFDRTIEKLKLNKGITDTRDKVVFHTTRHTFASWAAMSGTPLPTLQKLMGHKTIEMTLRYAHLCPGHEREAAERLAQEQPQKVAVMKKKATK
jgi:integrase